MTCLLSVFVSVAVAASPLIPNGGFEDGLTGWSGLWTRDRDVGSAVVDVQAKHTGKQSVRIEHRGQQDWNFSPNNSLAVQAGDILELQAWLKIEGDGKATLCTVLYGAGGKALSWSHGARSVSGTQDWMLVRSRFIVPDGITRITPRLTGQEPATVWLDDFAIVRTGNLDELREPGLQEEVSVRNAALSVTLNTGDGTLSVEDQRIGRVWHQKAVSQEGIVRTASSKEGRLHWDWYLPATDQTIAVAAELDGKKSELVLTVSGKGSLASAIRYPHPFITDKGTYLVVPMNEGISYPVEDASISPMRLVAYGGHGICMGFWGATDGESGYLAILETPDDASVRIDRNDGLLYVAPEWDAQCGKFGDARRLHYVFLDSGGHVAMCKRYRQHARDIGRLKTFGQKRQQNPNVDLLIGAVNVWCWERDALDIVRELRDAGIERILWSHRQSPETIAAMNEMGILTSRYDIYQDTMNPDNFKFLRGVHADWTTRAWPDDLMLDANGDWRRGWRVRGKDGQWYPCGVLCDRQAVPYARERVSAELQTHAYRCRFIDTTTASPYRECYHKNHPMTRGESRHWKMELLRFMSEEMNLVTGSETGHDAAVPYTHYFEGMLSLGPYRVPDSGRNTSEIWDEVPERVAKFQVGHKYRLPLWELVYHDCVVAQWYWGDYNNKLPAIWDKRDLFNALYGTPPMFMFNRRVWNANKERFVQSYRATSPVARATGYAEMTDHRFLTQDRDVQQTVFANGVTVTVNFGEQSRQLPNGVVVQPMSHHVTGLRDE